jgi:ParB/RepB/Spo0J family partition protein
LRGFDGEGRIELQDIAVTSIRPSPSNPRKTFRHLDQLAASFTAVGQIDPVTVRPLPKEQQNGITHELVVGERRWRAAPLAKLKTLKAIVRELDDKQVAEIQIVENDQRDDIHPLEQADGYHALEKLGYSVEQIATKVSRSTEFVRKRLKLVALIPEAKAALLAEKILPSVAMLIARIPDLEAQKKALAKLLPEKPRGGFELESGPATVAEAQRLLRDEFMLKLADAPFDRGDAKLTPAGACTTCPKRTGAQAELFADVDSPDLCTDPKCHQTKVKAHWQLLQLKAKDTKQPFLTDAQAKKVFVDHDGIAASDHVQYNSGYVRAIDSRWLGGESKTAKQIVGPDVKPTLALAPNGKIVELYPKRSSTRLSASWCTTQRLRLEVGHLQAEEHWRQVQEQGRGRGRREARRARGHRREGREDGAQRRPSAPPRRVSRRRRLLPRGGDRTTQAGRGQEAEAGARHHGRDEAEGWRARRPPRRMRARAGVHPAHARRGCHALQGGRRGRTHQGARRPQGRGGEAQGREGEEAGERQGRREVQGGAQGEGRQSEARTQGEAGEEGRRQVSGKRLVPMSAARLRLETNRRISLLAKVEKLGKSSPSTWR